MAETNNAMKTVRVTDDLTYADAEQMLLTLIDESERGEEMRRLYHYLRECNELMGDIGTIL